MLILLNTSVVTRLLIFLTLQVLFVNYHFYIFLKVYI